jgi:formylglycine-generating enzyme required for sulfatase activity
VKSDWVRDEAERGKRRSILVPVLIDDVDIPLGFGRFQAAQLFDLDEMESNEEFERLSGSIAGIIGSSSRKQEIDIQKPEEDDEGKERVKRKKEKSKSTPEKEEKTFTNSIGMKFIRIPAGKFMMGSEENVGEKPIHEVTIGSPFYIGMYQVTQKEWEMVMGNNPSEFKGDNHPVEKVRHFEVERFIEILNAKEGTDKYRLPSEAEWEYAARAGTTTRYFFGDDESELGDYAWYAENSGSKPPQKGDYYGYDKKEWLDNKWNGKTHPVGQKKPNRWGLFDMHGNVFEWIQDTEHSDYNRAPTDGSSWEDVSFWSNLKGDIFHVVRGGSWFNGARDCRSANRTFRNHGWDSDCRNIGIRLVRAL